MKIFFVLLFTITLLLKLRCKKLNLSKKSLERRKSNAQSECEKTCISPKELYLINTGGGGDQYVCKCLDLFEDKYFIGDFNHKQLSRFHELDVSLVNSVEKQINKGIAKRILR